LGKRKGREEYTSKPRISQITRIEICVIRAIGG
jgi:hypothetical protein